MSRISLTEELRTEYHRLFTSCVVRSDKVNEIEALVDGMVADRDRYQQVAEALHIPWYVVGVLHALETERNFACHLHNGDPLTERTRHLPDGHPQTGEPPFSWEESAIDALQLRHLNQWQDWSIAGTLFCLEDYNSWSYRLHHPEVPSPYLWSYSTHYQQGKYVTDDAWSDTATFTHCGAAVLLRRLAEREMIEFIDDATTPVLRYLDIGTLPEIAELQAFLNRFPGIFVRVDGHPGLRTSEAFNKLTGHYLLGDPREAENL